MAKVAYEYPKINERHLAVIDQANAIIEEYQEKGYELTLRSLYYQFVARGLIANKDSEYKNLGTIVGKGRMSGLIDWDAITDRTRFLRGLNHWSSPKDIISASASQFRIDKWSNQPYHLEVWMEKDAVMGYIDGVCNELDVPYFSCRGYTSMTEMRTAALRLQEQREQGKIPVVIHLGDHDPSGKDMTHDIERRMETFIGGVQVERIALNMDQIQQYKPPPNPAKLTDSRGSKYVEEFGDDSWELDALSPEVLTELVRDTIMNYRDEDLWEESLSKESGLKRHLTLVHRNWNKVVQYVQEIPL